MTTSGAPSVPDTYAVRDKGVKLAKRAAVEQQVETLACCELALGVLFGKTIGTWGERSVSADGRGKAER